jgi:fluoride exporter
MTLLYVALGSAIGGVGRFLISGALQRGTSGAFPVGTLLVNVVGSFVLGFVARYALGTTAFSPDARVFLTAGLCGGFTTFSTFSYESFELLEHGHHAQAAGYIVASLALSLLAAAAGVLLARNVASA